MSSYFSTESSLREDVSVKVEHRHGVKASVYRLANSSACEERSCIMVWFSGGVWRSFLFPSPEIDQAGTFPNSDMDADASICSQIASETGVTTICPHFSDGTTWPQPLDNIVAMFSDWDRDKVSVGIGCISSGANIVDAVLHRLQTVNRIEHVKYLHYVFPFCVGYEDVSQDPKNYNPGEDITLSRVETVAKSFNPSGIAADSCPRTTITGPLPNLKIVVSVASNDPLRFVGYHKIHVLREAALEVEERLYTGGHTLLRRDKVDQIARKARSDIVHDVEEALRPGKQNENIM